VSRDESFIVIRSIVPADIDITDDDGWWRWEFNRMALLAIIVSDSILIARPDLEPKWFELADPDLVVNCQSFIGITECAIKS